MASTYIPRTRYDLFHYGIAFQLRGRNHPPPIGSKRAFICCPTWDVAERDPIWEHKVALNAIESTKQLGRLVPQVCQRIQKAYPAPADNYLDLKLNIATFIVLIWLLFGFGDSCDYYKNQKKIYNALDMNQVQQMKGKFTAEICRQITWAILNDGRSWGSFFDNVTTEQDIEGPLPTDFPQ